MKTAKISLARVAQKFFARSSIRDKNLSQILDDKMQLNLHHTRGVMPKRVTSGEAHLRGITPEQHSSEETSQRWQTIGDTVSTLPAWESNLEPPAQITMFLTTIPTGRSYFRKLQTRRAQLTVSFRTKFDLHIKINPIYLFLTARAVSLCKLPKAI